MGPESRTFPPPKLERETDDELQIILASAYYRLSEAKMAAAKAESLITSVLAELDRRRQLD